jgi:hypothetical protein
MKKMFNIEHLFPETWGEGTGGPVNSRFSLIEEGAEGKGGFASLDRGLSIESLRCGKFALQAR